MPKAVVHRRFLEITPKEPEEVRRIWNYVHICLMVIAGFSGWLTAYTFGMILEDFDFHCVLFASMTVSPVKHNSTSEPVLWKDRLKRCPGPKIEKSKWSANALCNYVQFVHVASMLSSIIWIVFFAVSGRGNYKHDRQIIGKPYRLVLPFLFWSILSSLIIFITNSTLHSGFVNFCAVVENAKGKVESKVCYQRHANSYKIMLEITGRESSFARFVLMKVGMYTEFVAWACNALWTCLRIYLIIDYKFYMVTIWKFQPSKEKKKEGKHNVNFAIRDA